MMLSNMKLILVMFLGLSNWWPEDDGGGGGSSVHATPIGGGGLCEVEATFHLRTMTPMWEANATSITGCYSQHVTELDQEVHVLHLRETSSLATPHVVTVNVRPMMDHTVHAGPLVIALFSEFSVHWRLVGHRLSNDTVHRIFVTKGSQVIESKDLNVNIKRKDIGRVKHLLAWLSKRLQAVTSYAKIEGANNVHLKVGIGDKAPAKCNLRKRGSVINVEAFYEEAVPISQRQGCIVSGMTGSNNRVVHVVKIHETHGFVRHDDGAPSRVTVNLQTPDGHSVTRDVALVLQAQNPVEWVLHPEGIWGRLDVVTDGKLDTPHSTLRQRISIRTEPLPNTTRELLSYARDWFGPSFAFTEVWQANRLDVVVDDHRVAAISEKGPRSASFDEDPTVQARAIANKQVVKAHLQQGLTGSHADTKAIVKSSAPSVTSDIIRMPNVMLVDTMTVECLPQQMTVSFPRLTLEKLGFQPEDISLIDDQCYVSTNSTHYVLSAPFYHCGTSKVVDNDKTVYKNAVTFHFHVQQVGKSVVGRSTDGGAPIDDEDGDQGSGAGAIVTGGAASQSIYESATKPRALEFQCEYVSNSESSVQKSLQIPGSVQSQRGATTLFATPDLFRLELYKDPSYVRMMMPNEYPFVAFEHETLYMETRLKTAGSGLKVVTEDCWLSETASAPYKNRINLVRNTCPADLTVRFESIGDDSNDRFSFQLASDYMEFPTLYLHCKLGVCAMEQDMTSKLNLKPCASPHYLCTDSLKSYLEQETRGTHYTTFTKGPFHVKRRTPNSSANSRIPTHSNVPLHGQGKLDLEVIGSSGSETIDVRCAIPEQQNIIILGLSTEAVIGIAFASFIIGVGLSAVLWCIYLKTDPLRRPPHRRVTHSSGYDLSGHSGSSTPSSQSPMTA